MTGRRALLVGIDDYDRLGPGTALRGCVADARLMASVLAERYGFDFERDSTLLLDGAATREGILAALDELVGRAERGDVVAFFYAGHGARVRLPGRGWAESIVPIDSGRGDHPNRDVLDTEVAARVAALNRKTPHVTLLMDCCHSGSVTRSAFGTRGLEPDARAVDRMFPDGVPASIDVGGAGRRAVTLAACRRTELANERAVQREGRLRVQHHGALSWPLARALLSAPEGATWRGVFERAAPEVTARFRLQRPVLEGDRDAYVFGRGAATPTPYLRVGRFNARRLEVQAGAAHGLVVGAPLRLLGPAGEGDTVRGSAEVVRVGATRAVASIRRLEAPLGRGFRAVPAAYPRGLAPLAVAVDADLAGAVGRADGLEVVDTADADVVVRREGGAFVARDRGGGRIADADDVAALVDALVRYRRFVGLVDLQNPASRLPDALDFGLYVHRRGRLRRSRSRRPAVRVTEGTRVDFRLRNRGAQRVFVTLADFAADHCISLLVPNPHDAGIGRTESVALEPGEELRAAAAVAAWARAPQLADGLPLSLAGLPDEVGRSPARPALSHVLAFVTTRPADFSWVAQAGTFAAARGAERGAADWVVLRISLDVRRALGATPPPLGPAG